MTSSESSEPKIIVDNDWKEQVAKEKEAAKQRAAQAAASVAPGEGGAGEELADFGTQVDIAPPSRESSSKPHGEADSFPPPPHANFETLLSMLFTQAIAMLGQIPNPVSGKAEVNKPYAKHYIDTLEMLGEKTKGNLTSDEAKMLSEALHALRMTYVNVRA